MRDSWLILMCFTLSLLPGRGITQEKDSVTVKGNVLTIHKTLHVGLLQEIGANRRALLRIGHFNFPSDSCNKGFRIFLSFNDKKPLLNLAGPDYLGSYFMGHDCATVFMISLKAMLQKAEQLGQDIEALSFTFQFLDAEGNPIRNYRYLDGVIADLLIL
jgi:hypothetical protein